MGGHPKRIAVCVAMLVSAAVLVGTAGAGKPDVNGTLGVDQAFVISNDYGNTTVGAKVMFWGADWWKKNALVQFGVADYTAPASFKGFAASLDPNSPLCGSFTTRTGNSSNPPAGPLPAHTIVLVTDSVIQSGSTITGTVVGYATVATDAGYSDDPGHPGTGTVESFTSCGTGGGGGGGGGGTD
ncbi:MAG TPA: hypothetical protein VFB35_02000 [Gaiellaceae bacterium]|nr:hypothetical protein [Gaiellaceae bacterium]